MRMIERNISDNIAITTMAPNSTKRTSLGRVMLPNFLQHASDWDDKRLQLSYTLRMRMKVETFATEDALGQVLENKFPATHEMQPVAGS
jgi:hypothetical protein